MEKVLSWRWSRLAAPSAWKRIRKWDVLLVAAAAGIALAVFMSVLAVKTAGIICICCILVGLYFFGILAELCCADDCFFMFYGGELCKVYVYETENAQKRMFYDICIKVPGDVVHIDAAEYEYKMFRKEHNCFIYRRIDDSQWYQVAESVSGIEIRNLGERLEKTVFLASEEGESPKRLRVLQRNSYKEFSAEMYVCGDMYFPLAAGEYIIPDKSFREQRMYPEACKKPYGYLFLKKGGTYDLIGLYAEEKQLPHFLFAQAPAVMFRSGIETVVLLAEKDGRYREFYRGESFIPIRNGNIVELDCGVPMYGRILRFNPETKTLEKKYEGRITSIGFQNGVVGIGKGKEFRL